ncbi:thioredoxin-disulfide reductase [Candidatus Parcubacteria bacterium]|nr:MAG: thioredoxin-disulfide reductase [Candidatus Parcubacteria bacterium]
MEIRKTIIIGSGPAGYTAGIYTARAELKPLLFAGPEPGGQLMTTTEVENWPSAVDGIMGPDLMANLKKQAEKFGAEIIYDTVTSVDLSQRPFIIRTADKEYKSETLIIATGAVAKWLNIPGETELKGKGVSACATCDGFFFKDKKVVIVGGGDAALEEATFLTKFASEVVILVRRDEFRASKPMQKRVFENSKITVMWNTEAQELIGSDKLEAVKVINNKTGEISEIKADGFFVSIGHKPNTDLFKGVLEMDEAGYLKVSDPSTKTNIEGVFACGDVADPYYRQAITAAGSGCKAALDAERFLAKAE